MGSVKKPENAGKPWTEEDIFLVASYSPTWSNIELLAKRLKRTKHGVQYMYCKIYTKTSQLKKWAKNDTKSEQYTKVLRVRKSLDIAIGM